MGKRNKSPVRSRSDAKPGILQRGAAFCSKTLAGAIFLSIVYFTISYTLLFPSPEFQIEKKADLPEATVYEIWISNPSIMGIFNLDVYNLEFVLRFDEKLPVRKFQLNEANYYSGIKLLSNEGWTLRGISSRDLKPYPSPVNLVSGIVGATDRFPPGTIVNITVVIDKTYKGESGDVFPPNFMPRLRSNCYYVQFQHRPLGEFAPMYISRSHCRDFKGSRSEMDNVRKYMQKTKLPDGQIKDIVLEVEELR
ncbi:MAG: hypothetical protein ABIF87_12585 [Pseudomonadota bacterium]